MAVGQAGWAHWPGWANALYQLDLASNRAPPDVNNLHDDNSKTFRMKTRRARVKALYGRWGIGKQREN